MAEGKQAIREVKGEDTAHGSGVVLLERLVGVAVKVKRCILKVESYKTNYCSEEQFVVEEREKTFFFSYDTCGSCVLLCVESCSGDFVSPLWPAGMSIFCFSFFVFQ